ncbi:MAG: hypothetical protein ACP5I4_00220 [Oceanipulchritudo sp.]
MRPLFHFRKIAWKGGSFFCHCLNLVLAALAIGQGGMLVLNLVQREIPLPDRLANWALNELGPGGFRASWSSVVFDLRGGLLLDDFVLQDGGTDEIILTARQTRMQWDPFNLLVAGIPPFSEVEARMVRIYMPASISPSGLNEPALFVQNAELKEEEGRLLLSSLSVQTGGLELFISGSAPLDLLIGTKPATDGVNRITLLQKLNQLPPDLHASALVEWEMSPAREHQFVIEGIIPQYHFSGAAFHELTGNARLLLSPGAARLVNLQLDGRIGSLPDFPALPASVKTFISHPVPFHLRADGPLQNWGSFSLPTSVRLSLYPRSPALPVDQLHLATNLWNPSNPVFWIASSPRLFAAGTARFLPDAPGPLPLSLAFRASLPNPSLVHFFKGPPVDFRLENLQARLLRIEAAFDPLSRTLAGSLLCDSLLVAHTPFAHLHSPFSLQPHSLSFHPIRATKAHDEFASGSYFHHLPSSRFSLHAIGQVFPASLDSLLGQWWPSIFADIQTPAPIPADVTVWGLWREENSLQSMTRAWGRGARYRGVEVPELEVRVRSNGEWAFVEKLEARFGEGSIRGQVALRSNLEDSEPYRAVIIDMTSDGPWEAVVGASGLDGLGQLAFTGRPRAGAKGTVWQDAGNGFDKEAVADLAFNLTQGEGTCTWQGLTMEGLSATGQAVGSSLEVKRLSGRFAEGVFTGGMRVEDWEREGMRRKEFQFQLFDAQYGEAMRQLTGLLEDPEAVRESLLGGADRGRLDTSIRMATGGAVGKAVGEGWVWLRDAQVGEIHLLGGLSRFLDRMGLDFSSLDLNAATLEWKLAEGILSIEKGLVTGPALAMELSGFADLASKNLALGAEVTLFSGFMGKLLSPVSETLNFDLTGPLDQPSWQVRLRPLRWFQNRLNRVPMP